MILICPAEMPRTLCTLAFPVMNTHSVPNTLHLTISIVSSCRLLWWTGANEENNFGVDGNYLMIVIVKVQLLVALEVGRSRLSEHILVART